MDLGRFLDLYIAETEEHLRLLHRSLLGLERDAGPAIEEAFRAAHTLKGLAAAMSYGAVAGHAHRLEDRLEQIRRGHLAPVASVVDELLEAADALEAANAEAIRHLPGAVESSAAAADDAAAIGHAPAAVRAAAPVDTAVILTVRLQRDAPIPAARALLVMRALGSTPGVLASVPAEFDDAFDGTFHIFLSPAARVEAIEAVVRGGGEVDGTVVTHVAPGDVAALAPPVAGVAPNRVGQAAADAASAVAGVAHGRGSRQVRVDAARLDAVAEGIAELSVLFGRLPAQESVPAELGAMMGQIGSALITLQHDVLALRTVPLREVFERLHRVVRDASRTAGKPIQLEVQGEAVELDRSILEEIGEPLVHLLRNAVDHGIENAARRRAAGKAAAGRITVTAERDRSSVRIVVADDGGGVDAVRVVARARAAGLAASAADSIDDDALFRLLSHPGLSTAERVSALSGRGVGLDVVVNRIRALGGAVNMRSEAGLGTTFTLRLPITLALAQALRVRVGLEDYAIALTHVAEAVELNGNVTTGATGGEVLTLRGESMPLVRLRRMLGIGGASVEQAAVVAAVGGRRAALAVDELIGREQILVKSFDAVVGMLPYFSGATLLADGRPALVLDPLTAL